MNLTARILAVYALAVNGDATYATAAAELMPEIAARFPNDADVAASHFSNMGGILWAIAGAERLGV